MQNKYDIFVSFKNSDSRGNKTKDSILAEELYNFLKNKGLKVFYSNTELEFIGKAQYTKVIDDALESSHFLIAVGCSYNNLNSQWVRYEWESFINDIRSGIKSNAEVFVLYQDITINELPRALRQQQGFSAEDGNSFEKIYNYIKNSIEPRSQETESLPHKKIELPNIKTETISSKEYSTISLKDIDFQFIRQYAETIIRKEGGYVRFKNKRICTGDNISKKTIKIFSKYFSDNNEMPFLFLDDTMFNNGKGGVLLTNKAIYFKETFDDIKRLEIEKLSDIRHNYTGSSNNTKLKRLIVTTDIGDFSTSLISFCSNEIGDYNCIVKILNIILFGEKYTNLLSLYEKNGWIYSCLDQNEKALDYLNKAINENDNAEKADYNKALELNMKKLEIQIKIYGEEHADVASTFNKIGIIYSDLDNNEKQLEYYKKGLELRIKVLGEEHRWTATSYNNVGIAYRKLKYYQEALGIFNKALEIRKRLFGEEHIDIADTYNDIGQVYYKLDNEKESLEYFYKAYEIRLKILGEHKDTSSSLSWLGCAYYYLNDYSKALEMHLKVLEMRLKVLGEMHSWTATTYAWLGDIYNKLNDREKSLEHDSKALEIRQKILPKNHPDVIKIYNTMKSRYNN